MVLSTSTHAAELFSFLEHASADLSLLRPGDLDFLKGLQLTDSFADIFIDRVEPTSLEIDSTNLPLDGTLSLRFGLTLKLRGGAGETFLSEEAVLWVTTDRERTSIELLEVPGAEYFSFELSQLEPILLRLGWAQLAEADPSEWRLNRAAGWTGDIGYKLQDVVQRHRYSTMTPSSRRENPGWHPCSCGWEGYWSAFEPHLADELRKVALSHSPIEPKES